MSNEQPTLSPDFDLDAWIDGTCGITASARIVQRGDLIAERERLADELTVTRKIKASERGVADRDPDTVQTELDELDRRLYESMLVVTIEDRTAEHRKAVRAKASEKLTDEQKSDKEAYAQVLNLVDIADAIIKVETPDGRELPVGPGGFGWERLEKIRQRCGDVALLELAQRYYQMTNTAPAVQAPFSPSSSSARGGITSRRS